MNPTGGDWRFVQWDKPTDGEIGQIMNGDANTGAYVIADVMQQKGEDDSNAGLLTYAKDLHGDVTYLFNQLRRFNILNQIVETKEIAAAMHNIEATMLKMEMLARHIRKQYEEREKKQTAADKAYQKHQKDVKKFKNKARCKKCGDIIESKHVHDYVTCKCGAISVDGGNDYWKAGAKSFDDFERLFEEW